MQIFAVWLDPQIPCRFRYHFAEDQEFQRKFHLRKRFPSFRPLPRRSKNGNIPEPVLFYLTNSGIFPSFSYLFCYFSFSAFQDLQHAIENDIRRLAL